MKALRTHCTFFHALENSIERFDQQTHPAENFAADSLRTGPKVVRIECSVRKRMGRGVFDRRDQLASNDQLGARHGRYH